MQARTSPGVVAREAEALTGLKSAHPNGWLLKSVHKGQVEGAQDGDWSRSATAEAGHPSLFWEGTKMTSRRDGLTSVASWKTATNPVCQMEFFNYYFSVNIGPVSESPYSTRPSARCFFSASSLSETLSLSGNYQWGLRGRVGHLRRQDYQAHQYSQPDAQMQPWEHAVLVSESWAPSDCLCSPPWPGEITLRFVFQACSAPAWLGTVQGHLQFLFHMQPNKKHSAVLVTVTWTRLK